MAWLFSICASFLKLTLEVEEPEVEPNVDACIAILGFLDLAVNEKRKSVWYLICLKIVSISS